MAGPLAGRGAVVTGAGRGIGAAVARALSEAGAAVVVAARTTDGIERVAAELVARGAKAWAATCDVADEESVRELARTARARLGTVDILVNNAGVSASARFERIELSEWNRMLAVNATGTFLCTREFAPAMVERGWGRIVNVASMAGLEGGKYVAHYSAAKHAVIGFTRSVAMELAGTGVTINALCPGYVDSPMTDETLANVGARTGLSRAEALTAVLATSGQERLVRPEEVAAAAVALCRDDARASNGLAVRVPAGETT
jgi:NAD(P)-dependent dehydrogenase (short-subunit alcohol dehydrogenase family)